MSLSLSHCASAALLVGLLGCSGLPMEPSDAPGKKPSGAGRVATQKAVTSSAVDMDKAAFQRALSLMGRQRYTQAEVLLESMPDASHRSLLYLLNLGISYSRSGKPEEAKRIFRQVLERDPTNAIGYNELGIVERKAGHFQRAGEAYQRALELRPDYAPAHLNLGILCDLYLQDAECAMNHYQAYRRLTDVADPPVEQWIEALVQRYPERQWGSMRK